MNEFARGAKIKRPVEKPITMIEAAYVCCDIFAKNGNTDGIKFAALMLRCWEGYCQVQSQANPGGGK